jgi:hypothetical protein
MNKQPDVVIAFENSTFRNPAFKPPTTTQPEHEERETGIAVQVPNQVPIKFDNPLQGSSPNDTASCVTEVTTPTGIYFSNHSAQTVILDPTKGD